MSSFFAYNQNRQMGNEKPPFEPLINSLYEKMRPRLEQIGLRAKADNFAVMSHGLLSVLPPGPAYNIYYDWNLFAEYYDGVVAKAEGDILEFRYLLSSPIYLIVVREENRTAYSCSKDNAERSVILIENCGVSKLAEEIKKCLSKEQLIVDDRFNLRLTGVTVELMDSTGVPFLVSEREMVALSITLILDVLDEEQYIIGGERYEEGRVRFEGTHRKK